MREQERRQVYAKFYTQHPIEKNHILYESYYGRGMLCNPYGIFRAFKKRKDFTEYEHFWVIKNWKENTRIMELYKNDKNVHFIRYMSEEYLYHVATAAYLINNLAFPSFYTPRDGQIYLNTWHRAASDKEGFDAPEGNVEARNIIRNFLAADYLLASDDKMKETYQKSFKLEGIYNGVILSEGEPRLDMRHNSSRRQLKEKLKKYGITLHPEKKLILYIPEENQEEGEPVHGRDMKRILDELEQKMKPGQYQILVRLRDMAAEPVQEAQCLRQYLIPGAIDLDEILACADYLLDGAAGGLKDLRETKVSGDNMQNPKEDGRNGMRILNIMIDHAEIPKQESLLEKIQKKIARKKEKILVYGSDLRENGVTYSLLSLLDYINYKKCDVTLLAVLNREGTNREKICAVHPNVRVITRFGAPNGTPQEQERYERALEQGIPADAAEREALRQYMEREFHRMFGRTDFDHLIEFTGYSPHYGMLIASVKTGRKYIWQHSDLGQETKKEIKKGVSLQRTLGTVFSLYPYYDKIVACSQSVRNLNRRSLANEATKDKFVYVRNSFSADRVRRDAEAPYDQIEEYRQFQRPEKECMVYANMGRLSPEKNQKNLIEAFRKLHEEYHDTKLYILGDGPLKEELKTLIREYHLEQDVMLTGNLSNPFALLKECGCFVLPSLYEGQPMSILEVRVLGLPIIISDFETRTDVCMPDGQLVVQQEPESIYQGMKQVYQNRECSYRFKPEQYNKKVYREFEKLLKGK